MGAKDAEGAFQTNLAMKSQSTGVKGAMSARVLRVLRVLGVPRVLRVLSF